MMQTLLWIPTSGTSQVDENSLTIHFCRNISLKGTSCSENQETISRRPELINVLVWLHEPGVGGRRGWGRRSRQRVVGRGRMGWWLMSQLLKPAGPLTWWLHNQEPSPDFSWFLRERKSTLNPPYSLKMRKNFKRPFPNTLSSDSKGPVET